MWWSHDFCGLPRSLPHEKWSSPPSSSEAVRDSGGPNSIALEVTCRRGSPVTRAGGVVYLPAKALLKETKVSVRDIVGFPLGGNRGRDRFSGYISFYRTVSICHRKCFPFSFANHFNGLSSYAATFTPIKTPVSAAALRPQQCSAMAFLCVRRPPLSRLRRLSPTFGSRVFLTRCPSGSW